VNNTDVEAPSLGYRPKHEINCKLVPQKIWLVDWNVDPDLTKMLTDSEITYFPTIL